MDALRARSQALEELLAALPERPAVARAATAVPIESLEAAGAVARSPVVDRGRRRGRAAGRSSLWRDRVEVMNSLVQLRYVEAQHVAL